MAVDVKVTLNTEGSAIPGLDRDALAANIRAELQKLAEESGSPSVSEMTEPAPSGAQGDLFTIHWLLHLAREPGMIKLYIKGIVFAVNTLVTASKKTEDKGAEESNNKKANIVRLDVLGKEFLLPATTAAIQSILDSIDWGS